MGLFSGKVKGHDGATQGISGKNRTSEAQHERRQAGKWSNQAVEAGISSLLHGAPRRQDSGRPGRTHPQGN